MLMCKSSDGSDDMDQRGKIREDCCRSEDVVFYHWGQTHFEVLDSAQASQEDHQRRLQKKSFHSRRSCSKRKTLFHGRTDESVLDFKETLKVELKNDSVQSFNTRWNETVIAMKKQPGEDILENIYYRQLQQSEQLKPSLSLYIQDTVQMVNRETTPDSQNGGPIPGTEKFVSSMSLLVKDDLKSPRLALLQPMASLRTKGKETV